MSDAITEELYKISSCLEKLVKQGEKKDERTAVESVHGFYAIEVETILDNTTNDFELRRALRNLVRRAKEISVQ